jgi:Domain of unknown function (DUF4389)
MATSPSRRSTGRILRLVFGAVVTLTALAILVGGAVLLWAHESKRDDQGYFTTSFKRFHTDSYALASESLDLSGGAHWLFEAGRLGRIRVHAGSGTSKPIFVGIARTDAVRKYLSGAPYARVTDINYDPFRVKYTTVPGAQKPAEPASQSFWAVSASGPGRQTITWKIEGGRWSVVVMNADASRGVVADVAVGAKISWLIWVAVGLLVLGALVLVGGGLMIYFGARSPPGEGGVVAASQASLLEPAVVEAQTYPVAVEGQLDPHLSRWLWLVKWFLAIPHYVVLVFLWIAFFVLTVVAFFAILFTGRYPRSIFDFNVGVLRWSWRVGFYATQALGTDRYPPFTLDPVDYPATIDVPYPEQLSRGLVLVKWWLLAIPHYVILSFLVGGWSGWLSHWGWHSEWPGLLGVLVFIAGVVLLFTRRYPPDIFRLVLGINRWFFRVVAYAALMRDEYPPFKLDR